VTQSRLKFKPKYEKILELLLYLSHKKPNADHYQAVKLLYLADAEHFSRYGRPITFEKYCALKFGPVASNALDVLKQNRAAMKKFGIEELPFETEQLDKVIYIRSPKRAVDHDIFSVSDLRVFDEILAQYGNCTFGELYNITHAHFAYINAWDNRGDTNSADIAYEDMMEENSTKAAYLEELESVSDHM
tara:strand:- start:255 stop:821 length:567 start_codon:yes stop_codon:yes gene_type:complete